ncbi:MAG: hypothetical protein V1899_09850 [Planctomycetota bacterium]
MLLIALAMGWMSVGSAASEPVGIKMADGKILRCDILKVSKAGVVLKINGKEQTLPLEVITSKEVQECYAQIKDKNDANLRFDMGAYFLKKQLLKEAEEELLEAVKLDPTMTDKVSPLLKTINEKKQPNIPPKEKTLTPETKKEPDKAETTENEEPKKDPIQQAKDDFAARFQRKNIPPRTEAQVTEFLTKRKEELNTKLGGAWRMLETAHFYSFSNIPESKHRMINAVWLERAVAAENDIKGLYPLLCDVLRHKDGDKLWNNKCPIYFFDKFNEFQRFAVEIDGSPGAANSGGYFSSNGREVHICIPFMTQRFSEKIADRRARSTLYHEGTHAFLQLSGEDVQLSRWLHEGLAQFIEFWFDPKNNPDRIQRVGFLGQRIRAGAIPSWTMMRERPMGGMDSEGYSWAWAKLEFLYRNFDNQKLPTLIRALKSGKKEEDAIQSTFGYSAEKLEAAFEIWVKEMAKNNFKFTP